MYNYKILLKINTINSNIYFRSLYFFHKFLKIEFNFITSYLFIKFRFFFFCLSNNITLIYNSKIKRRLPTFFYYLSILRDFILVQLFTLIFFLIIFSMYCIKSDINTIICSLLIVKVFFYLLLVGFIYLLNRNNYLNNLSTLSRF